MASLSDNDFELFGLPLQFAIQPEGLTQAYLQLQNQMHPDRYTDAPPSERRMAAQWSTRINEAYKRLQNPTDRAIYLCELAGLDPRGHQSKLPAELLMQQMEWREQLAEADSVEQLEDLLDEVAAAKRQRLTQIANQIDEQNDVTAASANTQALLFIEKLIVDIKKHIEHLEDAQ